MKKKMTLPLFFVVSACLLRIPVTNKTGIFDIRWKNLNKFFKDIL